MNNENINDMDMDDDFDGADSEAETPKRKRGRQKGVKIGPRMRTWVLAAVVDGKLIQESIKAKEGASDSEKKNFSKKSAIEVFQNKFGVKPESVKGPFHDHKGGNRENDETIVEIDVSSLKLSKESFSATFGPWKGTAYPLEDRDDVVYFVPSEEIIPSGKKNVVFRPVTPLKSAVQPIEEINQNN